MTFRAATIATISLFAAFSLCSCQAVPLPTQSSSRSATDGAGGNSDVDTSNVEGSEPGGDLVDPCSLLSVDEVEAATGVKVLKVVRGEVHADGSQLCAFSMDAKGSTAAAMAGQPGMPAGGLGDVVNTLESGTAVIGILLSEQDPETDSDSDDAADPDEELPAGMTSEKVDIGKGGVATATANGGAAFAANDANVSLTIMDLIAGPASVDTLKTLLVTAYGRL